MRRGKNKLRRLYKLPYFVRLLRHTVLGPRDSIVKLGYGRIILIHSNVLECLLNVGKYTVHKSESGHTYKTVLRSLSQTKCARVLSYRSTDFSRHRRLMPFSATSTQRQDQTVWLETEVLVFLRNNVPISFLLPRKF